MRINKKQKLFTVLLIFSLTIGGFYFSHCLNRLRRPNVILITLDALRPDHLGCYGYKRNTSPNIDKIAQEGVIFTQAISQAPHTAPSVTSLITSTYPNIHNLKDWGYQFNPSLHLHTLPEVLRHYGYKTCLISNQLPLSLIKDLKRGFITYNTIQTETYGPPEKQVKINEITDWAINWLQDNKHNKFFLWLYYLDPHAPYTPPEPYDKAFMNDRYYNINKSVPISDDNYFQTPIGEIPRFMVINNITEVDYYISQYDGEIGYVDSQIGRLYKVLKSLHLDKNTIIIITSDHGEAMGEHNLYFRHCTFLYDELIKVPLIIKFSKLMSFGKKIDTQVRSIDIMPTILDILGISINRYRSIQGTSFLPLIFNQKYNFPVFAFSEFLNRKSIRTKGWKLIYDEENGQFELYNLKKDPQELNNVVAIEKDKFEFLKHKLNGYIQQASPQSQTSKLIFDEEAKESLKSLGYIN